MSRKILLVCHGYPFERIGGVGQVIEQLITHLPKLGWNVHVLVPTKGTWIQDSSLSSLQKPWGTLHCLQRSVRRWSQSWSDNNVNDQLVEWVSHLKPEVIHLHHLDGLPWEWLIQGKQVHPYRLWLTLHDYALPCARGQLLHRFLEVCEGPQANRCTLCLQPWLTLDGWQRKGLSISHQPEKLVSRRLALAHDLLKAMDRIDAPSQNMIAQFRKIYPSISVEQCTLPMPTITTAMATHRKLNTDNHRFLFVGSIHPSKGLHLVLRAFAQLQQNHPNISLSIIGHSSASDLIPSYERIWKDFSDSFPNIEWLGSKPHQNVLQQMLAHHTLVLPSVWQENSPIVIREALQRGMSVICGNGGSAELSPSILRVQPLSVTHLMYRMQETMDLPTHTPQTYPSPKKTIAEWIAQAIDRTV